MTLLVFLACAAACLVGSAVAAVAGGVWSRRMAVLGAVAVFTGAVWLTAFVFAGDPYTNGEGSRWSHRTSHGFVYAAWVASAAVIAALLAFRRKGSRPAIAVTMFCGVVLVLFQVVAADTQNLN